jgi:hypothetical protein
VSLTGSLRTSTSPDSRIPGLHEPDANAALSKEQANKWMERAEATCTAVVRDRLAPELATAIEASLGKSDGPWLTFEVEANSHSPVLLFHYARHIREGLHTTSASRARRASLARDDILWKRRQPLPLADCLRLYESFR